MQGLNALGWRVLSFRNGGDVESTGKNPIQLTFGMHPSLVCARCSFLCWRAWLRWADDEETIAEWKEPYHQHISTNGKVNFVLVHVGEPSGQEIELESTDEFIVWKAVVTNLTSDTIPASTLRARTTNGMILSCAFGEIGPNSSGEVIIEGSVATTTISSVSLLVADEVTVTYESMFGVAPAS